MSKKSIPILPIITSTFPIWLKKQPTEIKNWITANNFTAKSSEICLLPNKKTGLVETVLLGVLNSDDYWAFGALPKVLQEGSYHIETNWKTEETERAAIAWGLGAYQFSKYKKREAIKPKLMISSKCSTKYIDSIVAATNFSRDLINLPSQDFSPKDLGNAARDLAKKHSAKITEIVGEDLLKKNFPAVYAVGKGGVNKPRIIDLHWGNFKKAPHITLVGKGVCFDSGGWDLKPSSGMRYMKEDMAGAAYALTVARLIMEFNLKINLRVIIPAVENLLDNVSYKPGDVIKMRSGKTVEIHNTDAEGRMILADALTLACEEKTDLLLDFATLTGAARVALGNDINAMFTDDDKLAEMLAKFSKEEKDPMWRLPLYESYWESMNSSIADFSNCSDSRYGGTITAALFLKQFVKKDVKWVHFDIAAWNYKTKPGRPEGGEIQCLRTIFKLINKFV